MLTETKACPYCAETIQSGAIVCKHCGLDLVPPAQAPIPTAPAPAVAVAYQTPAPAGPTTSGTATAALVLAFVFPVIGLILGYVAKSEIRRSNGAKTGDGLATAAIVVGWVLVGLFALGMLVIMSSSS